MRHDLVTMSDRSWPKLVSELYSFSVSFGVKRPSNTSIQRRFATLRRSLTATSNPFLYWRAFYSSERAKNAAIAFIRL